MRIMFTGLLPGLSPRRFKQQRRRRLTLVGIQLLCFFICVWSATSTELDEDPTSQPTPHQHRRHLWPQSILPTSSLHTEDTSQHEDASQNDEYEEESEASSLANQPVGQHKLRKHRSVFDDNNHRALRRKEVPVNYRLYDDLLRNYNKAARSAIFTLENLWYILL
jgi:hypothetical protein